MANNLIHVPLNQDYCPIISLILRDPWADDTCMVESRGRKWCKQNSLSQNNQLFSKETPLPPCSSICWTQNFAIVADAGWCCMSPGGFFNSSVTASCAALRTCNGNREKRDDRHWESACIPVMNFVIPETTTWCVHVHLALMLWSFNSVWVLDYYKQFL